MVPRGRRLKRAHYAPVSSRRIYACRRGMRHFATRILEHQPLPSGGKDSVMSRYSALLMLAAAFLAMSPALAQQDEAADYPNRPVKIVVSVPAGGGVDTAARIFAASLQQRLGQPFVIENRGGGGGNIGAETVYAADPDGYTLLASQPAPITSNIALYKKLNFDPAALESVAIMTKFPNVLLVRQDFPAKTVQEFIAYAKANPGKITYASQGPGTTSHLTAELFMKLTGTKMLHVPYRGTGPALNDLVAGHVDFIFMELASAYKLHEAQKSRILAVATDRRLDILPHVPTLIEVGVPGFISDTWNAISAPPKTAAPIILKLNRAINEVIAEPEAQARFRALNVTPVGGSPQDMAKFKREETERWSKVIRDAGIEPE
ncbi:MAG: tripartite tricarboxylate transporter substrate binding protein [Alphaproteobacteria bacterium]|nr:MAG: tripartite tricarboxylate transporter substrate binding protein [Alphaproteobacteria bacterium]TMK01055.1 MAG: tripartite tricarboxylate transporter substrate binding protein [Alphaproteobacteria bacterium]